MESALLAKFFIREEQKPTVNEKKFRHPATKQLIQMVADDVTIPIGTRAAILVAWDGMLRASEYCSNTASTFNPESTLLGKHIRWDKTTGSWALFIAHSKSDRFNQGTEVFIRPRSTGDKYCAAQAIRCYYEMEEMACTAPNTPFFRKRTTQGVGTYVTRDNVSAALRKHAAAAGLPPSRISSHSIRIGGAFAMRNAGMDWNTIMLRGRWSMESNARMAIMYSRMSVSRLQSGTDALSIEGAVHDPPLLPRFQ
jgi:integrase